MWTQKEIDEVLGQHSKIFSFFYGVQEKGNVPRASDIQGELINQNVLIETHTIKETSEKFSISEKDAHEILQQCRDLVLIFALFFNNFFIKELKLKLNLF